MMRAHVERTGGNRRLTQLSFDLRRTEAQLAARQRQAKAGSREGLQSVSGSQEAAAGFSAAGKRAAGPSLSRAAAQQ